MASETTTANPGAPDPGRQPAVQPLEAASVVLATARSESYPEAHQRIMTSGRAAYRSPAAFTRHSLVVDRSSSIRSRGMSAYGREDTPYRCCRRCRDGGKLGGAVCTRPIRVRGAVPRRRGGIRPRYHRGTRCWSNRTGIRGVAESRVGTESIGVYPVDYPPAPTSAPP